MGSLIEDFRVNEGHRNMWIAAWLSSRVGAKVHILRKAALPVWGHHGDGVGDYQEAEAYCGQKTNYSAAGITGSHDNPYGFLSYRKVLEQADCQRCLKTFRREVFWICLKTGEPHRYLGNPFSYTVNLRNRTVQRICRDCRQVSWRPYR